MMIVSNLAILNRCEQHHRNGVAPGKRGGAISLDQPRA
jgi:hypothetical protein